MIEPLLDPSVVATAKRAEILLLEWIERGKVKTTLTIPRSSKRVLFVLFASNYDCSREIQNMYNEYTIPLHGQCILITSKLRDHIYTYEYDFVDVQAIIDFEDLKPLTI